MWLRRAEGEAAAAGRPLAVEWRSFSLEQINSKTPEEKAWEHPERRWRGLPALAAAQAVRLLAPERFPAFHQLLFEARHELAADIADPATLDDLAAAVGLDRAAFARARASAEAWAAVGRDHEAAVALGVFGVPTLVVGDRGVFLKMQPLPATESALGLLDEVLGLLTRRPYLFELKQPASVNARPRP